MLDLEGSSSQFIEKPRGSSPGGGHQTKKGTPSPGAAYNSGTSGTLTRVLACSARAFTWPFAAHRNQHGTGNGGNI